jgi:hypothetical protein
MWAVRFGGGLTACLCSIRCGSRAKNLVVRCVKLRARAIFECSGYRIDGLICIADKRPGRREFRLETKSAKIFASHLLQVES